MTRTSCVMDERLVGPGLKMRAKTATTGLPGHINLQKVAGVFREVDTLICQEHLTVF